MLGRRGEDHRLEAPRPAAQRRRDRQAERDDAQREYDDFDPFQQYPGGFPIPSEGSGSSRRILV
ncbi:hypothetical protein ACWGN5_30865 [Streptomyces sp. NPDC055815]